MNYIYIEHKRYRRRSPIEWLFDLVLDTDRREVVSDWYQVPLYWAEEPKVFTGRQLKKAGEHALAAYRFF